MRVDVVTGWQRTFGLSGRDGCAGLVREVAEREIVGSPIREQWLVLNGQVIHWRVYGAACWYGCLQNLVRRSHNILHFELLLGVPQAIGWCVVRYAGNVMEKGSREGHNRTKHSSQGVPWTVSKGKKVFCRYTNLGNLLNGVAECE